MFSKQRTAIRNNSAESNLFSRRALIAFVGVCVLILTLIVNLYHIQVNSFQSYQTRADGNRIKIIPIAPNRGVIFDRNGVILAENKPIHSLELVSEKIKDLQVTVDKISRLIELTTDEKERFFKSVKAQRRFKSIALKTRLSTEEVAIISVNLHHLPGVAIEARLKRFYPYGASLTHVLGYVGRINAREQKKISDDHRKAIYIATRDIGKIGIEKYYEQLLHGNPGYQEVEVNSRGRIFRVLKRVLPEHGQDLYLNIDIRIQQVAYDQLAGRRGSVVALDPNNGAVLAMVSSPSYDPNLFVHGISTKAYKKLLSEDKPLINRSTRGAYPPASTIKQIMALAALEEKIITEHTSINDPGYYKLPNVKRKFRDYASRSHGKVDIYKALMKSCDTYFYDVAHRLGINKISEFMFRFGFGEYTGIDIHEEKKAVMPSRDWKRARYNQPWHVGDTINVGIGQGYWTATPLQLAKSVAIIANNGKIFTPQILGASQGEKGLLQIPADDNMPIVLSNKHHWRIVQQGMWQVVNQRGGTAYNVFKGAHYQSAGKTGTAQVIGMAEDVKYDASKINERHRDNAMYVGYAPFDNPEIAIAVAIENAGGGGSNAAPIARAVLDVYLAKKIGNKLGSTFATNSQQGSRAQ